MPRALSSLPNSVENGDWRVVSLMFFWRRVLVSVVPSGCVTQTASYNRPQISDSYEYI